MMPGNIAVRTIRVEKTMSDDARVLAMRATDKFISMINEVEGF